MKLFVEFRRTQFLWAFAVGGFAGRTRLVIGPLMISVGIERDD